MASEPLVETESHATAQPAAPRAERQRDVLATALVAYAAVIVFVWLAMHLRGDRGPWATLFLFGPRWLCAVPLIVLLPATALFLRRWLWLPAVTAVLVLGPILGFRANLPANSEGAALRVLTCNVQQLKIDPPAFSALLERTRPDIVALQEVSGGPRYDAVLKWPAGWFRKRRSEYVLASRYPVERLEWFPRPGYPGKVSAVRYRVTAPDGPVQIFNVHLISPRWGFEAVLDSRKGIDLGEASKMRAMLEGRQEEARQVSQWIAQFPGPKIVLGDFNTPVESTIYRQDWSWLENAFSNRGLGFGQTKITEKFGWSYGTRIDHILYTPPWHCLRVWVGADVGSDHLPLVAEFEAARSPGP